MKVISVGQLNRYVKSVLESDSNLAAVYIGGEISNFTHHYKSGHLYLTLKDDTAAVKAVMFKGHASKLAFRPEDGMRVIVRARISLYEATGSFQIYIEEMQPDGVGALQVAYEQLKKKLAAEGLFDESRKRPLPPYPTRVGVITSPTGAAVRDILNVLGRRYPLAQVVFCPVLVQGEGAASSIASMLERIDSLGLADVILLGRGGGSIEDLWAFNEMETVSAVYRSDTPIISCVGHETDFTICDFVADRRAPTPSAAAEIALPETAELKRKINNIISRECAVLTQVITRHRGSVKRLSETRSLRSPMNFIDDKRMHVGTLTERLALSQTNALAIRQSQLKAIAGKMEALNPLSVLSRGYSAVYGENGEIIKHTEQLTPGASITFRLADGEADAQIREVRRNET